MKELKCPACGSTAKFIGNKNPSSRIYVACDYSGSIEWYDEANCFECDNGHTFYLGKERGDVLKDISHELSGLPSVNGEMTIDQMQGHFLHFGLMKRNGHESHSNTSKRAMAYGGDFSGDEFDEDEFYFTVDDNGNLSVEAKNVSESRKTIALENVGTAEGLRLVVNSELTMDYSGLIMDDGRYADEWVEGN